MYQLEILVNERINDLRREAEQERLAASAAASQQETPTARNRVAASTMLWAGRQLSHWGDQLQKEYSDYGRQPAAASK